MATFLFLNSARLSSRTSGSHPYWRRFFKRLILLKGFNHLRSCSLKIAVLPSSVIVPPLRPVRLSITTMVALRFCREEPVPIVLCLVWSAFRKFSQTHSISKIGGSPDLSRPLKHLFVIKGERPHIIQIEGIPQIWPFQTVGIRPDNNPRPLSYIQQYNHLKR